LFLGRGINYPLALEGALKLKEISYIHAEGYAAGELKHGPIALVDEHVPVIVIAPRDELYEKTISNMEEVAARGGKIVLITDDLSHKDNAQKTFRHIRVPMRMRLSARLSTPSPYSFWLIMPPLSSAQMWISPGIWQSQSRWNDQASVRPTTEHRIAPLFLVKAFEIFTDLWMAYWTWHFVNQQVLLGHIGHVFGFIILCQKMIEGLVLARARFLRN
jgi:hypothetical protein